MQQRITEFFGLDKTEKTASREQKLRSIVGADIIHYYMHALDYENLSKLETLTGDDLKNAQKIFFEETFNQTFAEAFKNTDLTPEEVLDMFMKLADYTVKDTQEYKGKNMTAREQKLWTNMKAAFQRLTSNVIKNENGVTFKNPDSK